MNVPPDSHHSRSEHPGTAFPFSQTPPSTHGPETVINPERRGVSASVPAQPPMGDSSVWNRLFPVETPADAGDPDGPVCLQLEHFVLEERIGSGGMGAVFRALDQRLERSVALKVLGPAQSRDAGSIQRFQNEARAAAKLDHDNIARVYYVGEAQGVQFIAYEYVTGTNIRDMIRTGGRLDPDQVVNYALQIASALKHTSAAGVVHRDIKPSNIIVTPEGRAKIVDLGLARKPLSTTGELTTAGTTLGTFDYISPEQAKDPRNVDVRSDIYSLGCTLYHMLTGVPPYPEGTVLQKLLDHQGKAPPNPADKNRTVPKSLSRIVQKMMASDPQHRYRTADELIRDLILVASSMGLRGANPEGLIWSSETSKWARFWERHLGWMATAAVLLLIVFLLDRFPEIGQERRARSSPNAGQSDGSPEKDAGLRPNLAKTSRNQATFPKQQPTQRNATTEVPTSPPAGRASGTTISADPRSPAQAAAQQDSDTQTKKASDGSDPGRMTDDGQPVVSKLFDVIEWLTSKPSTSFDLPQHSGNGANQPKKPPSGKGSRQPAVAVKPQADDRSSNTAASSAKSAKPFPMKVQPPAISIVAADPQKIKAYPTLEAACSAAQDGDVIELCYNGSRGEKEKPLRVNNKKITIRGAKGCRPLIDFKPQEVPAEGFQTRMITLSNGSVDLINLDLLISVREEIDSEQWSLFSLNGSEQVRLQSVNVTFSNPGNRPATLVELTTGSARNLADMETMKNGQPDAEQEFTIKIVGSLLRGGCELFVIKHSRAGRFHIEQSAVAIEGTLLYVLGDDEVSGENSDLKLELEHVTCLLGGGLLKIDSGELPRYILPVHVSARNNIFATNTSSPLISMYGNTNVDDFHQLLRWDGAKNFYGQFALFWSIRPTQATAEVTTFGFEAWTKFLSPDAEVDAHYDQIVWKQSWLDKEFVEISGDDLALDQNASVNPVVSGATDGDDAGAVLPQLPVAPAPAESQAE